MSCIQEQPQKECIQMPRKMARSDPRPSVRVTRGAGSGQHLASVLQEGRENANIDAGLGFIWRISVQIDPVPSWPGLGQKAIMTGACARRGSNSDSRCNDKGGSKMMFRSRAAQTTILAAASALAFMTVAVGDHACAE